MQINKLNFVLFTLLAVLWSQLCIAAPSFQLQPGDLLFQELNCGTLCTGIDKVTYGADNTVISHVGMVFDATPGKERVIEADSDGVVVTPLSHFLSRNSDAQGAPTVMVGRLTKDYQHLIPLAIAQAKLLIGKPYNPSFRPNAKGYYCSQLIATVYQKANHNQVLFASHPMNFLDEKGKVVPVWQEYFDKLHVVPPQGQMGTNPGALSRSPYVMIVYRYGQISTHKLAVSIPKQKSNFTVGFGVFRSQVSS